MSKPLLRSVYVPIYGCRLYLSISDDAHVARRKLAGTFGESKDDEWHALCDFNGPYAGIFFFRDTLTHGTLAHEIFHATIGIIVSKGDTFGRDNEESFAYLNGWITDWVYRQLLRAKITPQIAS
jgi:hypothetical protein